MKDRQRWKVDKEVEIEGGKIEQVREGVREAERWRQIE